MVHSESKLNLDIKKDSSLRSEWQRCGLSSRTKRWILTELNDSQTRTFLDNADLISLYSKIREYCETDQGEERAQLVNAGGAGASITRCGRCRIWPVKRRGDHQPGRHREEPGYSVLLSSKIMKDLVTGGLVQSHIGSRAASRWPRPRARSRLKTSMRLLNVRGVDGSAWKRGPTIVLLFRLFAEIDLGRGANGAC